ncbi:MAG: fibronectin type III domain-containing protein [Ignavibacteria bacterium]
MKLKIFLSLIPLFFSGCIIETDISNYRDFIPPSPPKNIYSITGDNWVELNWQHNLEPDLDGYNIYRSFSYSGRYEFIGFTKRNYFVDYTARNGNTYYYAITAVDFSGNESDLSTDVIYDTPRPEGYNQVIFDFRRFPNNSGYDFSSYSIVPFDNDNCDMFFDNDNGKYYMVVYDDTDIQDMGLTNDIYDIDKAPISGWSPTKDVRLYVGHTYVVWTWDNHYAKFRVKYLSNERVVFDWAYQLVEGNRELRISPNLRTGTRDMKKQKTYERINDRN